MKINANVGVFDILVHVIIWLFLTVITFGIALFFYPYSFAKFIINRSELVDDQGVSRTMICDNEIFGNIGHVILWMIISLLTLGIGYIFYFYKVWNYSINNTRIE
jgi:membrane protein YdbS with pleckstrin-like domain